MSKDYYQILGVDRKASKEDIKKAFRGLAQKYHPDKTGGDEAKFKEVNEAYQVLSDDKKRSQYDVYGNNFSQGGGGGAGGFGGFDFSGFQNAGAGGFDINFEDIFGDIFGGGGRGRGRPRGSDISIDVQLSFKDSIFGTDRTIMVTKNNVCSTCNGSRAKLGSKQTTCIKCNGKGKIRESRRSILGSVTVETECAECFGSGKVPEEECNDCRGSGIKKESEKISLRIPAGISNGEMIRLSGKGEAISGGMPGDLYVKIHVEKDERFVREGANIVSDIYIKLSEALLGSDRKLETLDGEINLKIPAGINHGEVLRIKGSGVPIQGNKRGDLLVVVHIVIPNKISKKAKEIIESLKQEGL